MKTEKNFQARWKDFLWENSICDGSCTNPDCGGKDFPEILLFFRDELDAERMNVIHKVRKMLAFEGVLSMSVEKGFQELVNTLKEENK